MPRRPRLVNLLWRWHRRLGLLAALFVLVLAVTGVVLNHSSGLGLDRRFVDWPWLNSVYGDASGDLAAFELEGRWVSRAANGLVYLDGLEVAPCSGTLVGAVQHAGMFLAGCEQELLLIAPGGELIEAVTASTGLPSPLSGVGLVGDVVVLRNAEGWWLADLEVLEFRAPAPGGSLISQLAPDRLPESIRNAIPAREQWLNWERVLLDLHSGRIAGRVGVLWMDFIGVLLGGLAMSGIAMWWLHRRRGRR